MNDPGTRESLREMCEVLFLTKEQRAILPVAEPYKRCTGCQQYKPESRFHNHGHGLQSRCKDCNKATMRKARAGIGKGQPCPCKACGGGVMIRLLRCHHCRHSFRGPRTGRTPLGCSPACKKAIQKARQAVNKHAYKRKELLRQCAWCLQLFTVTNHKKKKFCNVACTGKYRHWAGVEIPVTIKERVLQLLTEAHSSVSTPPGDRLREP